MSAILSGCECHGESIVHETAVGSQDGPAGCRDCDAYDHILCPHWQTASPGPLSLTALAHSLQSIITTSWHTHGQQTAVASCLVSPAEMHRGRVWLAAPRPRSGGDLCGTRQLRARRQSHWIGQRHAPAIDTRPAGGSATSADPPSIAAGGRPVKTAKFPAGCGLVHTLAPATIAAARASGAFVSKSGHVSHQKEKKQQDDMSNPSPTVNWQPPFGAGEPDSGDGAPESWRVRCVAS